MTGAERIKLAAAEFRDPDAIEGVKKIMLAAAECVDPDALPGPVKIKRAARDGEKLSDGPGVARIRAAAGLPVDETDSMAKELTMARDIKALDGLLADLQQSVNRPLPAWRVPLSRPPRPTPVRTAPAPGRAAIAARPPLRFDSALGYWDFRDRLAGDLRTARVHPTAERMVRHARATTASVLQKRQSGPNDS